MPCASETFDCKSAKMGSYALNMSQISRLTKTRDFRPNDDQKDEIIKESDKWLVEQGFENLTYKTQYFETRPVNSNENNLAPGIGTIRLSWIYVPCSKMTVMA